jgi:hypothetical protein
MAIQAKPDRSLRLVLSGASADVTLVISDSAERPVATMVVAPAQLREIVQSFGNILRLVEGEAASGALPVNAPWQKTGFVVDAPAWRATQEGATGLVVLSLQIAPDAWWSFTLPPEQARELGQRLSASVGGEPAVAVSAVAALPQGFEAAGPGIGPGGDRTARSGGSAVAAPPEGAEGPAPGGAGAGSRTESAA